MPDVEIIELHHEKADAPSGTAIKTAALIAESRNRFLKQSRKKKSLPVPAVQGPTRFRFIQFDSQEKLLIRK